jgi:UDP-N-acetylmuramyl tripeptide synthase
MAVVGERDHDLRARAQELSVQLSDRVGIVENDLRHERPALKIAAPLQLEEVALSAEDDVALETFEER